LRCCRSPLLDRGLADRASRGAANLIVGPDIHAASVACNLLRVASMHGTAVGGLLVGASRTAHVLTPSYTVPQVVHMTALAVLDATSQRSGGAYG
jgi:malate dehydrogenase (oxaloacetate-decarboxylating)(NADP+)